MFRFFALVPALALCACGGGMRNTTPGAVDADAPWFTAFGIPAKEALRDPGTVSAMARALDDDRLTCRHKAAVVAHMAEYQPAALREHRTKAETRLRACGAKLFLTSGLRAPPLELAAALKPLDPKLLVPMALDQLFSTDDQPVASAAMTLKALGYAGPEVLSALKKVCETAPYQFSKSMACGAHGALEAMAAGGFASTDAPAAAAGAREMVILAVFDVQDPNQQFPREMMDQLTEYLATKVAEGDRNLRIVPRDQLRERLRGEKAETFKQCYDQSCQIELGRAIAAQKTLASKILKVGDKCAITATLFDLKTETAERSASFRMGCAADALMDGMDKIAGQLTAPREGEEKR